MGGRTFARVVALATQEGPPSPAVMPGTTHVLGKAVRSQGSCEATIIRHSVRSGERTLTYAVGRAAKRLAGASTPAKDRS
jgi:hypothetical protein